MPDTRNAIDFAGNELFTRGARSRNGDRSATQRLVMSIQERDRTVLAQRKKGTSRDAALPRGLICLEGMALGYRSPV